MKKKEKEFYTLEELHQLGISDETIYEYLSAPTLKETEPGVNTEVWRTEEIHSFLSIFAFVLNKLKESTV